MQTTNLSSVASEFFQHTIRRSPQESGLMFQAYEKVRTWEPPLATV